MPPRPCARCRPESTSRRDATLPSLAPSTITAARPPEAAPSSTSRPESTNRRHATLPQPPDPPKPPRIPAEPPGNRQTVNAAPVSGSASPA